MILDTERKKMMSKIYTIGFTKKDARTFFELLRKNKIKTMLDIRLNNISQLSGFAKGNDLKFSLKEILDVEYIHDTRFSPTKDLLDRYKGAKTTWLDYEKEFVDILIKRNIKNVIQNEYVEKLDGICLLCSEFEAEQCHRRLVAEYIMDNFDNIEIIHI